MQRDIGSYSDPISHIRNAVLERERLEIACQGPSKLYQLTDDFKKIENLLGPKLLKSLYEKGILFDWLEKSGFVSEIPFSDPLNLLYKVISPELREHEAPKLVFHILDDFRSRLHCEADSQQEIMRTKQNQSHLIETLGDVFERNESLIKGR